MHHHRYARLRYRLELPSSRDARHGRDPFGDRHGFYRRGGLSDDGDDPFDARALRGGAGRRRPMGRADGLHRSSQDRLIAGVCGGIAEWLDWDPTLVRILYVLISFFSAAFPGILVYVVLWLLMPEDDGF